MGTDGRGRAADAGESSSSNKLKVGGERGSEAEQRTEEAAGAAPHAQHREQQWRGAADPEGEEH